MRPIRPPEKGRGCKDCHLDPVVLGFGQGKLTYRSEKPAAFDFEPTWGDLRDGLPADAWIGFLESPRAPWPTRSDARPLAPDEQKRALLVGACLTCHEDGESTREAIHGRYPEALGQLSPQCIVPESWLGLRVR